MAFDAALEPTKNGGKCGGEDGRGQHRERQPHHEGVTLPQPELTREGERSRARLVQQLCG